MIKAFSDIATPEFSNTVSLEQTSGYDEAIDDDGGNGDEEDGVSDRDGKYDYLNPTNISLVLYFCHWLIFLRLSSDNKHVINNQ